MSEEEDNKQEPESYSIELNYDENNWPYKECINQKIDLYSHEEIDQNYNYIKAKMSKEVNYVALIGKGKKEELGDILYIWKMDNIYKNIKTIKKRNIYGIEFHPKENSYVIVYEDRPPCFYSIDKHARISKFKDFPSKEETGEIISYSFSPSGCFFGISYENLFIVWKTIDGTKISSFKIKSPLKYSRGKNLLAITEENVINIYNISSKMENPELEKSFKMDPKNTFDINYTDILAGMISPDFKEFYFITNKAIYRVNLTEDKGKTEEILEFNQNNIKKAQICEDCSMFVITDLRTLYYYGLDDINSEPGKILKEDFKFFEVHPNFNYLITVDDISVNITDTSDNDVDEIFIWLDENVKKFETFYFSPDFLNLLAITSEHSASLYNIKTGRIIKKWYNKCENWSDCCKMAPETSETAIIATKSTDSEIKIWNINNGNDVITLPDFNSASMDFSKDGKFLAIGGKEGEEIARFFDLSNGDYTSFKYEGANINTKVLLSKKNDENGISYEILIAASENQTPIVYNLEWQDFIFKCEKKEGLELAKIYILECSPESNIILVNGDDKNNVPHTIVYSLKDGKILHHFENCKNSNLSKDKKLLFAKCDNENEGKLFIMDLTNNKIIDCGVESEISNFLQGSKALVCAYSDKNKKVIYEIRDPSYGEVIGNLIIQPYENVNFEMDISAEKTVEDINKQNLIFRFIQINDIPYNLSLKTNEF